MKLTIKAKNDALASILKKVFSPQFDRMLENVTEEFKQYLDREHSKFFEALKDPDIAHYLSWGFGCHMFVLHDTNESYVRFVRPVYGLRTNLPEHKWDDLWKNNRIPMNISDDIQRPSNVTEFYPIVPKNYYTTWAAYIDAQATLSKLFDSYTTVEKLLADFPEYESYFVKDQPVKKNLLMVQVGEIRGTLSSLGVPSE